MSLSAETPTFLLLGVVVVLILLAVGIFVLILVYLQRSQSKKQPSQAQPNRADLPPSQEAPTVIGEADAGRGQPAQAQAPAGGAMLAAQSDLSYKPAHPGEVMRVIRDQKTGRVVVEIDGQPYTHIREIKDAQTGRRVLWAIADLVRFTGGMATNPQAVRTVTESEEEPSAASSSPPPPAPLADALEPTSASPVPRQRYNMVDFFRRGFQREPSVPEFQPSSFVDEIEAILQTYIAARPTPLDQEVHVKTGEGGKLQIQVGLDVYGSSDEVPDPEIQELIKTAVAEWEKR